MSTTAQSTRQSTARRAAKAAHSPVIAQAAPRFVVVHGGARDSYQVATALEQHGMLQALVTDLYASTRTLGRIGRVLPASLRTLLGSRSTPGLPADRVRTCGASGLLATMLERWPRAPFAWRRMARRYSDARLGRTAGRLARRSGASLLAYSYFAEPAFRADGQPALLFQVHPHPLTVRRILQHELDHHPQCAASLQQEWELALPAHDLAALVRESQTARAWLAASSFTRQSLIEHGVPAHHIHVVPYGVDLQRFHPASEPKRNARLELLFVGRINQRKGLMYLLQALEALTDVDLHLTICGRVVDDLQIFAPFGDRVTIRPSVSSQELLAAYQSADLFVFPSVAEGFGQVLLEALACGLPILSTTHTAAPDLIDNGVEGWIVPPREPAALAGRIRWAAGHRDELQAMGRAARQRAEQYTWQRFRHEVALVAQQYATCDAPAPGSLTAPSLA